MKSGMANQGGANIEGSVDLDNSIILQSLRKPSIFKNENQTQNIETADLETKELFSVIPDTNDQDQDYLSNYIDYDEYDLHEDDSKEERKANDAVEDILFTEFPLEDGYVRIPSKFPGLQFHEGTVTPKPTLWSAEEAFSQQVNLDKCLQFRIL